MAFLNILKFFYLLNQIRYGYQITQVYFRVYSSNNEKIISKQLSRMSMRKKFTFFPHNFDFFQGSKFFRNFSSKCSKLLQNKKFWLSIGCQVHTTWGLFALNWERRNSLYFGDRADNVCDFWFFTSFLTPSYFKIYSQRKDIVLALSLQVWGTMGYKYAKQQHANLSLYRDWEWKSWNFLDIFAFFARIFIFSKISKSFFFSNFLKKKKVFAQNWLISLVYYRVVCTQLIAWGSPALRSYSLDKVFHFLWATVVPLWRYNLKKKIRSGGIPPG